MAQDICACRTASPPRPSAPSLVPTPRDQHEFLVDQGCSPDGLDAAMKDARTRVSEQVEARLESEWETTTDAVLGTGRRNEKTTIHARTRIVTEFEDADLIQVDPATAVRLGNATCVTARLRRTDAARRVADRWTPLRERLDSAAARGRAARGSGDVPAFAQAWNELEDALAALAPLAVRYRTFTGRDAPGTDEIAAIRQDLRREADRLRSSQHFRVLVETPRPEQREAVEQRLLATLSGLRLQSALLQAGEACPAAPGEWRLTARVEEPCRRGLLGEVCQVRIVVEASPCAEAPGSISFVVKGASGGAHANDAQIARARAWAAVTDEQLAAETRKALGAILPVR